MFRCDFCDTYTDKSEARDNPLNDLGLICEECWYDYCERLDAERHAFSLDNGITLLGIN